MSQAFAIEKPGSLSDALHAFTDLDLNRGQLQKRSGGWGDERVVPPLAPGQPPHIRKAHERLSRIEEAHRAKVQKEAQRGGRPWFENNSANRRGLQIVIPGRRNRTTYKWLVLSTHKLGQVMNSYCRTISITRSCIRFFYNNREVRDDDTPDSIGMDKDIETMEWRPATGFEEIPECTHPHEPNRILRAGDRVKLWDGYGVGVDEEKEAASSSAKSSKPAKGLQDWPGLLRVGGLPEANEPTSGSDASSSHELPTPAIQAGNPLELRKKFMESLNLQKGDAAGASSSQEQNSANQRAYITEMTGPRAGQQVEFSGDRKSLVAKLLGTIGPPGGVAPEPSSEGVRTAKGKKKKKGNN